MCASVNDDEKGSRAEYSWQITNVGLETVDGSSPRPRARPRTKQVLPEPSGPSKASASPPRSFFASDSPMAIVIASDSLRNTIGLVAGDLLMKHAASRIPRRRSTDFHPSRPHIVDHPHRAAAPPPLA